MMTTKQIAGILDHAAMRAESISASPASGKQCWFIATLMERTGRQSWADEFLLNNSIVLTKKRASQMIESLLAIQEAN